MALRDDKGRWVKGSGSPNPKGRNEFKKEQEYLQALQQAITPNEVKEIASLIKQHLLDGKLTPALIKLVFHYLIPQPQIHKTLEILDQRALTEMSLLIGKLEQNDISAGQYFYELNRMLDNKSNDEKQ